MFSFCLLFAPIAPLNAPRRPPRRSCASFPGHWRTEVLYVYQRAPSEMQREREREEKVAEAQSPLAYRLPPPRLSVASRMSAPARTAPLERSALPSLQRHTSVMHKWRPCIKEEGRGKTRGRGHGRAQDEAHPNKEKLRNTSSVRGRAAPLHGQERRRAAARPGRPPGLSPGAGCGHCGAGVRALTDSGRAFKAGCFPSSSFPLSPDLLWRFSSLG